IAPSKDRERRPAAGEVEIRSRCAGVRRHGAAEERRRLIVLSRQVRADGSLLVGSRQYTGRDGTILLCGGRERPRCGDSCGGVAGRRGWSAPPDRRGLPGVWLRIIRLHWRLLNG